MGKINSYEYPDTQLDTLLKAIDILVTKFGGQANDEKTFAEALGHKTNQSGTFIQKMSDLRKYGFVEKRGLIATQRAKKIVKFLTTEEKQEELNTAIMEIKLWRDLYNRLKNINPSLNDFKIQLVELTSDRDKAISQAETIRNLYIDALSNYREGVVKNVNENSIEIQQKPTKSEFKEGGKVPESILILKSGEVDISLPRTETNIGILISILNELKSEMKKSKPTK